MHPDPTDEVVFTASGHFDWYWAPVSRQEEGLVAAMKRFGCDRAAVKVSPRPICRCCGERLGRHSVDDKHRRCRRHKDRNPCAIAGCSRTRNAAGGLHDGTWWLCAEHWRIVCPPRSPSRQVYLRFFRTAKKLGLNRSDRWPPELERRYWRFWMGMLARAKRQAAGDLDMAAINKMFGWD